MSREEDRTQALRAEFIDALVEEMGMREVLAVPIADSLVAYLQRKYPSQDLYIPAPTRQYDLLQIQAALERGLSVKKVCRDFSVSRAKLYKLFPGGLPRARPTRTA